MLFEFREESPTAQDYNRLRQSVGWDLVPEQAAATGLKNSMFSICVFCDGDVVAMGRVVGDRGIYSYMQDMIVHPDFQKNGLGTKMMEHLLTKLDASNKHRGPIMLMSADGKAGFYEKFGFKARGIDAPGMVL